MSGYIETFESANDLYLQHEKTWGKHKYISRTKKGGRWVYSYPKRKADIPTNSDIENLAGIDSTDPADAAVLKQYKDYFNSSEYQNSPHKAIKDLSFDEQNDLIKKVSAYKDKNLQAIQKYASGSGESRLKKLLASSAKHSAFSNGYIETFESVDDEYLEHFGIRGMHWGQRKARVTLGTGRKTTVGSSGGQYKSQAVQKRAARQRAGYRAYSAMGQASAGAWRQIGILALSSGGAALARKAGNEKVANMLGVAGKAATAFNAGYTTGKVVRSLTGAGSKSKKKADAPKPAKVKKSGPSATDYMLYGVAGANIKYKHDQKKKQ